MKFTPEIYSIPDEPQKPFIDAGEIWEILNNTVSTKEKIEEVIKKIAFKAKIKLI